MKQLSYVAFGVCGYAIATFLSMVGHLWLPKSSYLWGLIQVSGMAIVWTVILLFIALVGVWCVFTAASEHANAQLHFGFWHLVRALIPAIAGFAAVFVINGVALWLAY